MIPHPLGSTVRVLALRPDQVQHMPAPGVPVYGRVKAGPVDQLYAVLLFSNEIVHVHANHIVTTRGDD